MNNTLKCYRIQEKKVKNFTILYRYILYNYINNCLHTIESILKKKQINIYILQK